MIQKNIALSLVLVAALTGCASAPEQPSNVGTEKPEFVNDFPTQDRVEYVFECIAKNGGLKFETQHACTCMIDKIAKIMIYKDYSEARTFTFMRSTPGEKGALFRDPKRGNLLRKRLKEAEQYAEDNCFVR